MPLSDIRVIDMATVLAGPSCAKYLADFGADVIKVERPGGDATRRMGWRHEADDVAYMWKHLGRGKRNIVLDLRDPDDLELMFRMCESADVLVENLRPGKLDALGLTAAALHERQPGLVITRLSGFGQTGPYASRPGFATLAEAMSGFASINGEADGPPLLPPIALTDEVAGLAAAFATMVALHSGVGQEVDVNLLESMFQMMGPLISAYVHCGYVQPRFGSGIPYSVPRSNYEASDGVWIAVSTSSDAVAARVMALIGFGDEERFTSFEGRVAAREEIDARMAEWIGSRPASEVLAAFEQAEAAAAPVMTMADIEADPHYREREIFRTVDGVTMQGLIARLSATPGQIRWAGRALGADTDEIREEFS